MVNQKTYWLTRKPDANSRHLEARSNELIPDKHKVSAETIRFCTTAQGKGYLRVVTLQDEDYYLKHTLSEFLQKNRNFIQISKSVLVNAEHLDRRLRFSYIWTGDHKLKVSRHYRSTLKESLSTLFVNS